MISVPYSILLQSIVVFKEWELLLCLARRILIWYPNINNRSGWSNELSDDGEIFTNTTKMTKAEHVADCIKDNKKRIAFFHTKDALGIELYTICRYSTWTIDATENRESASGIEIKIYEL